MNDDYSAGGNPELTRALGREQFTWKSKDGSKSVFRFPGELLAAERAG